MVFHGLDHLSLPKVNEWLRQVIIRLQVAAEPQMAGLLSGFIYSSEGQSLFLRQR